MPNLVDNIKQTYNSIPTANQVYYSVPFDIVNSSYQGVPLISYAMIIVTTGILAFVTYAEKTGQPSSSGPSDQDNKKEAESTTPASSPPDQEEDESDDESADESGPEPSAPRPQIAEPIDDSEDEDERPLAKGGKKKHAKQNKTNTNYQTKCSWERKQSAAIQQL